MAKESGLGDNLYVSGVNLSGDTQELGSISGSVEPIEVTGIDKSAKERIGGQRDGAIEWTSYWNPGLTGSHVTLSALPTTDVLVTYCRGTSLGGPAACLLAKQIGYDGKRGNSGEYTLSVKTEGSAYGLEWGRLLTAGVRTDTTATNGTSIDTAASASFGGQAYLHVFAVTGTSVTVTIEDSADNSNWTAVSGFAFTAATGITTQRLALTNTATIRRYVRAVTTGTFTVGSFAVVLVKNDLAGQVF